MQPRYVKYLDAVKKETKYESEKNILEKEFTLSSLRKKDNLKIIYATLQFYNNEQAW